MNRLLNSILVILMIAGVATVYDMKYEAAEAERELGRLHAEIAKEEEAISMLHAEWALLNQPHRLAELVRNNADIFQLKELRVDQIVNEDQLAARIAEWTVPEDDRLVPDEAVDPIGLMAQRAVAEGR